MINGTIFENRWNFSKDWGATLRGILGADGIISGCDVTASTDALTVAAGYFIMCGRVLQNDGPEEIIIANMPQNGFVQLVYRVDLNVEPAEEEFTQGEWRYTYSATAEFTGLIQEDINATGSIYEIEFAVFQIANGAIFRRERMLHPAGIEKFGLYGADGGSFHIERDGDAVVVSVAGRLSGIREAVRIGNDGSMSLPYPVLLESTFSVAGRGARRMDAAWEEGDEFDKLVVSMTDKDGVVNPSMELFEDGSVNLKHLGFELEDDLITGKNIVLTNYETGLQLRRPSGNDFKYYNLFKISGSNDILIGDAGLSGGRVVLGAIGSVVNRIYSGSEGNFVDVLAADKDKVSITGNLNVSGELGLNTLKVSGRLDIGTLGAQRVEVSSTALFNGAADFNGTTRMIGPFSANEAAVNGKLTVNLLEVTGSFLVARIDIDALDVRNVFQANSDGITALKLVTANAGIAVTGTAEFNGDIKLTGIDSGLYAGEKRLIAQQGSGLIVGADDSTRGPGGIVIAAQDEIILRNKYDDIVEVSGSAVNVRRVKLNALYGLYVEGGLDVSGGLKVPNITTTGTITIGGVIHALSSVEVGGQLRVASAATFSSAVTVTGAQLTASNLYASNAGGYTGNLTVDGVTRLGGALSVAGAASLNSTLTVDGALTANYRIVAHEEIVTSPGIIRNNQQQVIRLRCSGLIVEDYLQNLVNVRCKDVDARGSIIVSGPANFSNSLVKDAGSMDLCATDVRIRNQGNSDYAGITASAYNNPSSRELKENIRVLDGSKNKLKKLVFYEYDRIDSNSHQLGTMADDEGTPEEIINTVEVVVDNGTEIIIEEQRCVDLYSLISLVGGTVQELISENVALAEKINKLASKIQTMEEKKMWRKKKS